MKRPFLGIGISFASGIIISFYCQTGMIISFALFLSTLIIFIFCIYKDKDTSYFLLLLFSTLAIFITSYNLNNSVLIDNIETPLNIEGIVDRILSEDENSNKYILKIDNISNEKNKQYINEKTVLKIIGSNDLEVGDKIKLRASFRIPMGNTNPKLYSYKKNLISKGIYTSISIKPNSIYNLEKTEKKFKYKARIAFRNTVENTFDKYLNENNSDLIKGIVLGDSTYLGDEDLVSYREIGLAHILAVSGLHIGIIAGAIIFILSRLGIKRKWNVLLTMAIIWIYAYLIGFPASVLRADIMFSLIFTAKLIAEPYDSINALFLSFLILLLFHPLSILGVGFQLSYAATFSILYFTPKIRQVFYPYENKLIYTISALLGIYIGIIPIQLYYFNNFSIMSIFSNILIAPIISFVLILSGALIIMDFIFPSISLLIGLVINLFLNIQSYLVELLYSVKFLNLTCASPNISEIILYYIFVCILFKIFDLSSFKRNLNMTIYIYLIALTILTLGAQITDQKIEIDFIDVGQGDSSLIKTRSGNYLLDTGGNLFDDFDIGANITLPYLKKHGVKKIKGVFISHFHHDHCKSIPLLMENIDIEKIYISYRNTDSDIYNYIMQSNIPVVLLEDGDTLKLDEKTFIEVLSPSSANRDINYSENNLSLVFQLTYYDKNILFTGDAELEAERLIENRLKRKVDILKVGHHGSTTSSSDSFLNKANPDIAIISVGRNNFYGHPHDDVIDRLDNLNCKVYRTDTMGMTRVILDKNKLEIYSFIDKTININDYLNEIAFILIYYLIAYIFIKDYINIGLELNRFEIQ